MIIYLIRHAEALGGIELEDREKIELGLSKYGRSEAKAVGKSLAHNGIQKIIASPIQRAKETAEIISRYIQTPLVIDERLSEFFPNLNSQGGTVAKLKSYAREHPEEVMPGGEAFNMAVGRLHSVILEYIHGPEEILCIVSHRVIIEGLLARLFNYRANEHEWLRNASVTAIEINKDSNKLLYSNRRYRDIALWWLTLKRKLSYNRF